MVNDTSLVALEDLFQGNMTNYYTYYSSPRPVRQCLRFDSKFCHKVYTRKTVIIVKSHPVEGVAIPEQPEMAPPVPQAMAISKADIYWHMMFRTKLWSHRILPSLAKLGCEVLNSCVCGPQYSTFNQAPDHTSRDKHCLLIGTYSIKIN